jgi:hypothetical protein
MLPSGTFYRFRNETSIVVMSTLDELVLLSEGTPVPDQLAHHALIVDPNLDLVVYADGVAIGGNVSLPGRSVKIFCRRLQGRDVGGKSVLSVRGADAGPNDGLAPAPGQPTGPATSVKPEDLVKQALDYAKSHADEIVGSLPAQIRSATGIPDILKEPLARAAEAEDFKTSVKGVLTDPEQLKAYAERLRDAGKSTPQELHDYITQQIKLEFGESGLILAGAAYVCVLICLYLCFLATFSHPGKLPRAATGAQGHTGINGKQAGEKAGTVNLCVTDSIDGGVVIDATGGKGMAGAKGGIGGAGADGIDGDYAAGRKLDELMDWVKLGAGGLGVAQMASDLWLKAHGECGGHGGPGGNGGIGASGGNGGTVNVFVPGALSAVATARLTLDARKGARGEDGEGGDGGPGGRGGLYPNKHPGDAEAPRNPKGDTGEKGDRGGTLRAGQMVAGRPETIRVDVPNLAADGHALVTVRTVADMRPEVPEAFALMLLDKAKRLYLTCSVVGGESPAVLRQRFEPVTTILDFLVALLESASESEKEAKVDGLRVLRGRHIAVEASAMASHLAQGCDYFGIVRTAVPSISLATCLATAGEARTNLEVANSQFRKQVEAWQKKSIELAKDATALRQAEAVKLALEREIQSTSKSIGRNTGSARMLEEDVGRSASDLKKVLTQDVLKTLEGTFQCSMDKILEAATMVAMQLPLSLIDRDKGPEHDQIALGETGLGASSAGVMMLGVQVASTIYDAATNVKDDQGNSVDKKYVLRKVSTLASTLEGQIAQLKETMQAPPTEVGVSASATTKLLATVDDLEKLVGEFTKQFDTGGGMTRAFGSLRHAIEVMNEKILELNVDISRALRLDSRRGEVQRNLEQAQSALADASDLSFFHRVEAAGVFYREALEWYLRSLHDAVRAYRYWTPGGEDISVQTLFAQSTKWIDWVDGSDGEIISESNFSHQANALKQAILKELEQIGNKRQHSPGWKNGGLERGFGQVVEIADAAILEKVRGKREFRVRVLPWTRAPVEDRQYSPFLAGALARLTNVRVWFIGAKSKSPHSGEEATEVCVKAIIKHGGTEDVIDVNGRTHTFSHTQVETEFHYAIDGFNRSSPKGDVDGVVSSIRVGGEYSAAYDDAALGGALNGDATIATFAGVGPYTTWTISLAPRAPDGSELPLNEQVDFTGVTAVRLEFCGFFYPIRLSA